MNENEIQPTGNPDEKIIRDRLAIYCEANGYHLSPDADAMIKDMVEVKRLTGQFYCPCQTQQIPETICICKPVRGGMVDILGACFCDLIRAGKK
jgi:ferredoxin-thioredoxin reductase catalytic subunit